VLLLLGIRGSSHRGFQGGEGLEEDDDIHCRSK
jgi:hypothetical protein